MRFLRYENSKTMCNKTQRKPRVILFNVISLGIRNDISPFKKKKKNLIKNKHVHASISIEKEVYLTHVITATDLYKMGLKLFCLKE